MDNAVAQVPNAAQFQDGFRQDIVHAVIVGSIGQLTASGALQWNAGTPAQQAVVNGLLKAVGSRPYLACNPYVQLCTQQPQVTAAAARFAALPAATRHAWLAANLVALKDGHITPAQIPWSAGPAQAAPGPAEPGSAAMTVADIQQPPRAAPAAGHFSSAARLAWLHLRGRRAPAALVALLACGAALWASLHYHWWLGTGNAADELPMILQGCAAGIIAVTTHSPFGEPERAARHGGRSCGQACCSRCARPPSGSSPSARRPRTIRGLASTWPAASSL